MTTDETLAKVHQALKDAGGHAKVKARDGDVVVEDVYGMEVYDAARALAKALGHTGIDIQDPGQYDWDALDDMIDHSGCDSCGHGSVLVLRGILAGGDWPVGEGE